MIPVSGWQLPWDEPKIKALVDTFKCRVIELDPLDGDGFMMTEVKGGEFSAEGVEDKEWYEYHGSQEF